ncbi:hypothetical protein THIOSC15_1050001 [uncultured Thiomicrorhabdus sp.]
MKQLGLKSVMYAGEGEPLLHKYIADIVQHSHDIGIDTAITSNGVKLNKLLANQLLPNLKWINFSVNAGSAATYQKVHRCKSGDFDKVMFNIGYACKVRKEQNLNCAIGVQILELPENSHEILCLAETVKELGCDYLVVKPVLTALNEQDGKIQRHQIFRLQE